jgi:uncharacterized protein YggE
MARTRQTARQSAGGRAPRRQISGYGGGGFGSSENASQSTLVTVFNSTQTRTIAVTGEDEFDVDVDIVTLSFKLVEEDLDYQQAIASTLSSLDHLRSTLQQIGVSNVDISSDAMSLRQRLGRMKDGEVVEEDSDEEEPERASSFGPGGMHRNNNNKRKKAEVGTKVTVYMPTIILRVRLSAETIPLFPRIMFTVLQMGVPNYEAPVYEVSTLTDHRHEARENAIINAQEKAAAILGSLDSGVCVGRPVTINDIHVDTMDIHSSDNVGTSPSWYLGSGGGGCRLWA